MVVWTPLRRSARPHPDYLAVGTSLDHGGESTRIRLVRGEDLLRGSHSTLNHIGSYNSKCLSGRRANDISPSPHFSSPKSFGENNGSCPRSLAHPWAPNEQKTLQLYEQTIIITEVVLLHPPAKLVVEKQQKLN
ncbi:hypothetical protein CDAR_621271 [Caerostris darwini]|uniref:Uncharacterized protein n=1 Tax=Caerostris darwini TaxID=1538125 RepID=A0AAV4RR85_9ARAC|nr:hypothetical protein CDAR_621271 [Caerostris darwini]